MFEELITRLQGRGRHYSSGGVSWDAVAKRATSDTQTSFVPDPLCDEAATALTAAQAEIERLHKALHRIKDWSGAYPHDVFTPLSDEEEKEAVDAMRAAVSNGSDRMHASWARHLMEGVDQIARAALAPKE